MEYTFNNFRDFKHKHGIKTKDIAEAIGTTENNVTVQLRPSKKLPTWARAMMFAESLSENTTSVVNDNHIVGYMCGCSKDSDGMFRRGKDCKLDVAMHGIKK